MGLEITGLYGGCLGLLLVVLSIRVVRMRDRFKTGIGSGGEPELARAIRVHGNFVEYVPLSLILLATLEIQGAAVWVLHFFGAALLLGRVLHAWGLSSSEGRTPGRFLGTLLTWLSLAGLSVANLIRFF